MKKHFETVIAGAGCAGMNCALELGKDGREYLLVSPNIGGRIDNDEDCHMNYGAVFYFGTYKYMLASGLLQGTTDVLPKLSMGQCHHDNSESYEPISGTTLKDLPSILSYMKWMCKEFVPRYSKFKEPDKGTGRLSGVRQAPPPLVALAEPSGVCSIGCPLDALDNRACE